MSGVESLSGSSTRRPIREFIRDVRFLLAAMHGPGDLKSPRCSGKSYAYVLTDRESGRPTRPIHQRFAAPRVPTRKLCAASFVGQTAFFPDSAVAMILKWILVILHIITAAAWFGIGLRLAGQARAVVQQEGAVRAALAEDGSQSVWLMNLFMVLTLVFSIGAFVAGGHFATYGPVYHTALLLIVVLTADQLVVIRGGWSTLSSLVEEASPDADALDSARKRVAIGTGVGHLIWLVLLVLMFVNRFVPLLT
jgi:hypothetical protein